MKKLIVKIGLLTWLALAVFSCKKENITTNAPNKEITSNLKSSANYEGISTDGRFLVFSTVDCYDHFLSSLEENTETTNNSVVIKRNFLTYLESLNYNKFPTSSTYESIVNAGEIENYPDIILNILNKDGAIQIGDHIYRLDFINQRVYVIQSVDKTTAYGDLVTGNTSNKKVLGFDWVEGVVDMVNSDGAFEKGIFCNENARPPREHKKSYTDKISWSTLLTYNAADTSLMGTISHKKFDGVLNAQYRWTPIGWDLYCKFTQRMKTQSLSGGTNGTIQFSSSWETADVPVKIVWSRRYKKKCENDTGWMNNITNSGTGIATGQSYAGLKALSKFELAASAYINPGNGFQLANFPGMETTSNGQQFQVRIVHGY